MSKQKTTVAVCLAAACLALCAPALGQQRPSAQANGSTGAAPQLPPGYVIGVGDVLTIVFWRERDMSADVVVRPDGKISLPLLNDVPAEGYTPEKLGTALAQLAAKFVADPNATVIVREIRSRNVFVVGQVTRPGSYQLVNDLNVLQVLALAGGLLEYADKDNIVIIRSEDGRERRFKFNYDQVVDGKKVQQNVRVQPGDTIVVR